MLIKNKEAKRIWYVDNHEDAELDPAENANSFSLGGSSLDPNDPDDYDGLGDFVAEKYYETDPGGWPPDTYVYFWLYTRDSDQEPLRLIKKIKASAMVDVSILTYDA